MPEFNADHGVICAEFLRRSRQYLANGNLLQASEKGWGAAAHAGKLFADSRTGVEYERHNQFGLVVTAIEAETNNHQQIRQWANSANSLHRNFYNDTMDVIGIENCINDVADFVNLARTLVGLPPA